MASVAGRSVGGRSEAGKSFAPDRMGDNILRLGRMTPSSMNRVNYECGMDALFASFPKSKQQALRQRCFEYLDVVNRKDMMMKRLGSSSFRPGDKPELLVKMEDQQRDAEQELRRIAGSSYGAVMAALADPEIQEAMEEANQYSAEGDVAEGVDARVWRRRLENRGFKRTQKGYRSTTHDHPTRVGNKSVWQSINTHDDTSSLSYYQNTQLKYGKSRRGSTSIAGAWEEIFDAKTGDSKEPVPQLPPAEQPSSAAAAAAAAHAAALSEGGHQYASPHDAPSASPQRMQQAAPAPPAQPASPAVDAVLAEAEELVREYVASSGDQSVLTPPPPPQDTAQLIESAGTMARQSQPPVPPPAPAHAAPQQDAGPPRAAQAGPAPSPIVRSSARRESVGARTTRTTRTERSAGGASGAFTTTGDSANAILPVVRSTPSAAPSRAKTTGLTAVMARHTVKEQHMIREMALDIAELLHRVETINTRLAEDPLYEEGVCDPPEVLALLQDELYTAQKRMFERLDSTEATIIISALSDRETRQDMGLLPESEEWAQEEGEDAARVWRRKLLRMKQQKTSRGRYTGMHDTVTSDGGRDIWNELNTADPDEVLSYYQRQQKRYGRGRRGSTAIAGAWAVVFAEEDAKAAQDEEFAATAVMAGSTAAPSSRGYAATQEADMSHAPAQYAQQWQGGGAQGAPATSGVSAAAPRPMQGGSQEEEDAAVAQARETGDAAALMRQMDRLLASVQADSSA